MCHTQQICLPLQLLPFPASVYPVLQLHWNEPAELVHVCAQPPLLLLHSLISAQRMVKWRKTMKMIFTSTLLLVLLILSSFPQSILLSNSTSHPSHLPLFHCLSPSLPSSLILHTNLIPKPPRNNQVKLACTYPTQ